jgi:hypothetical protein
MQDNSSRLAIAEAESVGGIVLPAIIAIAYACYLFLSSGLNTTNGWMLLMLGLGTLFVSGWGGRPLLLIPAYLLGIYLFGIIGLIGLVLAVSEESGWETVALSAFWTLLGWRCLAKASERRRVLGAAN